MEGPLDCFAAMSPHTVRGGRLQDVGVLCVCIYVYIVYMCIYAYIVYIAYMCVYAYIYYNIQYTHTLEDT